MMSAGSSKQAARTRFGSGVAAEFQRSVAKANELLMTK
jgi:hypothetical protein